MLVFAGVILTTKLFLGKVSQSEIVFIFKLSIKSFWSFWGKEKEEDYECCLRSSKCVILGNRVSNARGALGWQDYLVYFSFFRSYFSDYRGVCCRYY